MDYIYKIEIELDDEKIICEDKYEIVDIYNMIRKCFASEGFVEEKKNEKSMIFAYKKGDSKAFSKVGIVCNALYDAKWFKPYVTKMLWFDLSDDSVEDVLASFSSYDRKYGKTYGK